jgi:hypothetical protein
MRYLRDSDQLRLTLVCDRCGVEQSEYARIDYRPDAQLPADRERSA